jgi:Putative transposase
MTTARVAIANSDLIPLDHRDVTFKWKDYRSEGPNRYKVMTLESGRVHPPLPLRVLPSGVHRIRHYGLFAKDFRRRQHRAGARLLNAPASQQTSNTDAADAPVALSHSRSRIHGCAAAHAAVDGALCATKEC